MARTRHHFRAALIPRIGEAWRVRGSDDYLIVAAVLGPLVPVALLAIAASGGGLPAEAVAFAVPLIGTVVMMVAVHLSGGEKPQSESSNRPDRAGR